MRARCAAFDRAPAWSALTGALLMSTAASAQNLGGGEDLDISLGRIVLAFLISVGVAAGAILALRRRRAGSTSAKTWLTGFGSRQPAIRVIETRRISQHGDICLIENRGREYLLLVMAGRAQVLRESEITDSAPTGAQ
jgi:hypothetical protein